MTEPNIQDLAAKVADAAKTLADAKDRQREASMAETNARNIVSGCEKELANARQALTLAIEKMCGKQ